MNKKTRILIVDDDRYLGDTLTDILIEKGYETDYAASGFKALELIEKKSYALILLDLKMPELNGLETCKGIKKICPDCIIIAMTAFSLDEIIDRCIEEGASEVLYKPLDIDNLLTRIQTVTGS